MPICEIAPRGDAAGTEDPLPRVLLVEDNPGDAELIRILLERNGTCPLEVQSATRLDHAKARLRNETFAAIVLDLGLPDCQGIETLRRIQEDAGGVPIIILSGLNDFELSTLAVREGAQDYLSKGLLCGELLARSLRFALERHSILTEATADSVRDELTGLYNRRGFMTLAGPVFKTASRFASDATLVYLDLDGLKLINDLQGHAIGDQALRETAQTLREVFRESDIVARLGGDEFVVLALGDPDNAPTILKRVEARIAMRNAQSDRRYELSLSASAVPYQPQRHRSLEVLLQEGDQLMYQQKREKKLCRSASVQAVGQVAV